MIDYSFKINEEITRWVTEVYITSKKGHDWWIAFTNPTAGPWKKINALNEDGVPVEIYRFERETERPDLILVNDELETILVVEAKDFLSKLVTDAQMEKSVRVIDEVTQILNNCKNSTWEKRKDYKIIPSFLWYVGDPENIQNEDSAVRESYSRISGLDSSNILNIVITKSGSETLGNQFVFNGETTEDIQL